MRQCIYRRLTKRFCQTSWLPHLAIQAFCTELFTLRCFIHSVSSAFKHGKNGTSSSHEHSAKNLRRGGDQKKLCRFFALSRTVLHCINKSNLEARRGHSTSLAFLLRNPVNLNGTDPLNGNHDKDNWTIFQIVQRVASCIWSLRLEIVKHWRDYFSSAYTALLLLRQPIRAQHFVYKSNSQWK